MKPNEAVGDPTLVTFSDGSQDAYGACSYARWECNDGKYRSSLVAYKNRLSPVKNISIDRVELCAAVLNKRLKAFIEGNSRYQFSGYYHIVDSQIVRAMIQKETYGFNTFAATRIGEIQEGTIPADWYWIGFQHRRLDHSGEETKRDRSRQCMADRPRISYETRLGVAGRANF